MEVDITLVPVEPVDLVVLVEPVEIQVLVPLVLLGRQQTIPDLHNKVILREHLVQEFLLMLLVEVVVPVK